MKPPYDPEILYYIEDLNCFIKWKADSSDPDEVNGEWIQVNDFSPAIETVRSSLQGQINEAVTDIEDLDDRLTVLDKSDGLIAQIQTSITNIKGGSEESIANLVNSLNGIGDRTSDIETRLDKFNTGDSNIETVITNIKSTIDDL